MADYEVAGGENQEFDEYNDPDDFDPDRDIGSDAVIIDDGKPGQEYADKVPYDTDEEDGDLDTEVPEGQPRAEAIGDREAPDAAPPDGDAEKDKIDDQPKDDPTTKEQSQDRDNDTGDEKDDGSQSAQADSKPSGQEQTADSATGPSIVWSFTQVAAPPIGSNIKFSGQRATPLRQAEDGEGQDADNNEDGIDDAPQPDAPDSDKEKVTDKDDEKEGKDDVPEEKDGPPDTDKGKTNENDHPTIDDEPKSPKEPAEPIPSGTDTEDGQQGQAADTPAGAMADDGEAVPSPISTDDDPATVAAEALRRLEETVEKVYAEQPDTSHLRPLPAVSIAPDAGRSPEEVEALTNQLLNEAALSRAETVERCGAPTTEVPEALRNGIQAIVTATYEHGVATGVNLETRIPAPENILVYGREEWERVIQATNTAAAETSSRETPEPLIVLDNGIIIVNAGGPESFIFPELQQRIVESLAAQVYDSPTSAAPAGGNGRPPLQLARVGYAEHTPDNPGAGDYSALNRVVAAMTTETITNVYWTENPQLREHVPAPPPDDQETETGRYIIDAIIDEREAQTGQGHEIDVVGEVYNLFELGRLTGQTAIPDELVRATFGTPAAVELVSGWGAHDGYDSAHTMARLREWREQKLERDRIALEEANRQKDDAELAIEGLVIATQARRTGDLTSEAGADNLLTNRTETTTPGSGPSPSANRNGDPTDSPASASTEGPDGVHEPIFHADEAKHTARGVDENSSDSNASRGPGVSIFEPASERMNPGVYARTVRQTARAFGMSNRQMRQYDSIASLAVAVNQEINRRIGAAAMGVGANRLIQKLRTDDDIIQVERQGIVVNASEVQVMVERHHDNERRGPDIIAHAILNTVIRTERAVWLGQGGSGIMSKLYMETGKGNAPRVWAPTAVRHQLTPGQRAARERVRDMRRHPQQFTMGAEDVRRGQRYAQHPHRNPGRVKANTSYTAADFEKFTTPGQRFHKIVNRLRSHNTTKASDRNRRRRPTVWR